MLESSLTAPLLFLGSGGDVGMVTPIPFPEAKWEVGHDLSPSLLGEVSVDMVIIIPSPEGYW